VLADLRLAGKDLNGAFDYLSNQIMLPLGGFLIALFVGWVVSKASASEELAIANPAVFELWHVLVRYVVPPAVLVILVFGLFG
jgi:NSS family neurotransmitter:Na+ symporter